MQLDKLKNLIINTKRRNQIIAGLIISVFIVLVFFSDYGLIKRISLNYQVSKYKDEIEKETKIRDSLKEQISNLKKDTFLIEKAAREKYGMIKPGEKVILIEKEEE